MHRLLRPCPWPAGAGGLKTWHRSRGVIEPVSRPYSSHPPTWRLVGFPDEPPMHSVLSAAAILPTEGQENVNAGCLGAVLASDLRDVFGASANRGSVACAIQ